MSASVKSKVKRMTTVSGDDNDCMIGPSKGAWNASASLGPAACAMGNLRAGHVERGSTAPRAGRHSREIGRPGRWSVSLW